MAESPDVKKLELRISHLEQLVQGARQREPVEVTPEEMKAYQKVRDVMAADYGEFCGINDCFRCLPSRCLRCYGCYVCLRCDVECICGPCSPAALGGLAGTLGRFSSLGG